MGPATISEGAATSQRNWLIALRAPGLGSARLIELAGRPGGIDALSEARDLAALGLGSETVRAIRQPDEAAIERDLLWLSGPGRRLVTWGAAEYPELLSRIPSPPAALFVEGRAALLWQPQIAVVGSRNPTAGGRDNAADFAGELARRGLVVTSGLASGVDSAAHSAALDVGGRTIAVTGHGLDTVYPSASRALFGEIAERGALVSEFPTGVGPRRAHFPARNRIISGLSMGVLVIEAGLKSGSLITARLGAEQGREVFAIPGSIHNPMAKGCHRLIRDGARLVETADEIVEEMLPLAGRLAEDLRRQLALEPDSEVGAETAPRSAQLLSEPRDDLMEDPEYRKLWGCLGHDPKPIDTLIEQSGLTARAVSAMLLMLELRGSVEAWPGSAYSRTKRG